MKRVHSSVTLLLAAFAAPAFACINAFDSQLVEAQANRLPQLVAGLEQKHAAASTLETSNDLAVARILTGKYPEAIALLRETEKKFPGSAKVAANLGTALELSGNDTEALEWIREGVKRDADEHKGSEWLHARILEAKLEIAKNPQWLEKNRVLALDFGNDEVPVVPAILPITKEGRLRGGDDLVEDIQIQLEERTKFVKPPNAVVGDVARSLGDLLYAGFDVDPRRYYQQAIEYGAPGERLIRARIERFAKDHPKPVQYAPPAPAAVNAPVPDEVKERRPEMRPSSLIRIVWPVAALTLVLGVAGLFLRKRRRVAEAAEREAAMQRALAARTHETRTISS